MALPELKGLLTRGRPGTRSAVESLVPSPGDSGQQPRAVHFAPPGKKVANSRSGKPRELPQTGVCGAKW